MDIPGLSVVFLAGIATILTPCCLPLLPPLLAGSVGHRLRPLAIVTGSLTSFTALGLLVGTLTAFSPDALRTPAFLVIIAFGAIMVDEDLHRLYSTYSSKLAGRATVRVTALDEQRHPLLSAFVLGLALGLIWLPCVGPVLGAVLAYAAAGGGTADSGLLLFTYGVGFAMPLLGVAYGAKVAGKPLQERVTALNRPDVIRRVIGIVLLLSGVALLFDLDRLMLSLL